MNKQVTNLDDLKNIYTSIRAIPNENLKNNEDVLAKFLNLFVLLDESKANVEKFLLSLFSNGISIQSKPKLLNAMLVTLSNVASNQSLNTLSLCFKNWYGKNTPTDLETLTNIVNVAAQIKTKESFDWLVGLLLSSDYQLVTNDSYNVVISAIEKLLAKDSQLQVTENNL